MGFVVAFFPDQINERATKWGDLNTCSIYYYFPVIEIAMAVMWIVLIIMSRRQGERRAFTYAFTNIRIQISIKNSRQNKMSHSFDFMYRVIHKAWRLVVPAVVCFGISAICCCVYAAYLNSALNSFCNEFKYKFTIHEIPCRLHLNRFSMKDDTVLTAADNFHTAGSVAYIRIFQWLLAGFVMLLRCILGADFEMQEIEYCAGKCVRFIHSFYVNKITIENIILI